MVNSEKGDIKKYLNSNDSIPIAEEEITDGGDRGSGTYSTAGTYTWTCPPGVTSVTVECWGGGGRGGARTTGDNVALAGGGGGAYSSSTLVVVPGNIYDFQVGSGSTSTQEGGDSWFNSTATILAKGGNSVPNNSNTS